MLRSSEMSLLTGSAEEAHDELTLQAPPPMIEYCPVIAEMPAASTSTFTEHENVPPQTLGRVHAVADAAPMEYG